MGLFDDLIPQQQAAAAPTPQGGLFDDLIPKAAAPAPTPNAPFSATHAVTQAATGFNEGLASSVLRPLDAIPYFVDKAIGGEGVHPLENTFRKFFVDPNGEPQNRPEQVLRAGGRMAGDNIPLIAAGGAPVRAAVSATEQVAPGIMNTARNVANSVLDSAAAHPVAQTVGAFESGAGGQTARNIVQDNGGGEQAQQAAEIAGQFLTPVALDTWSKVSPTMLAAKGAKYVAGKAIESIPEGALPEVLQPAGGTYAERQADKLAYANREGKYADPNVPPPPEPNFVQRRMDAGQAKREANAKQIVGQEFNQILDQPDAAANMAEVDRLKKTIPDFDPGVAKATQDPALLRLQENIEANAKGDELRKIQQGYDANAQAVRNYLDNIVPPAGENPQDAVAAANANRVRNVNASTDQEIRNVQGLIQRRSDALPEVDRAAVGQQLRDIRGGEQQAADAEVQRLRANIADPNRRILQQPNPYNHNTPEGGVTVNEALDRRGQINNDIRDLASASKVDPQARQQMQNLYAERDRIDGALRELNDPGVNEYLRYYRDQYAPRFLEGPSRDIGRYDQNAIDKNRVQAEDVPSRFFGPNNISEARQFNRLYGTGNAPESVAARQAMTDYALDDLRHNVVDPNTNMIKEGAVNRWLQRNERLLNEMPWLRDAVEARNPDQLYQRLGELEQRKRAIADTKVASLVGKNPEQHIDAALKDWQTMRGLKSSVRGDPDAEAALRRAVIERAPDPMDADKFEKWLDDNDRSLRQVFDPSHLKALRDVLSASRTLGQLPRPQGAVDMPGSLADKTGEKLGISVPSLLQRVLAVKQGRMSPEYGVTDVAVRALRSFSNREAANAWKEALYNPKVATDLQTIVGNGKPTGIQAERLKSYLLSVGMADATGNDKENRLYVSPNKEGEK